VTIVRRSWPECAEATFVHHGLATRSNLADIFLQVRAPRPLVEIGSELKALEVEITALLKKIAA
jgi:hypothetical protein